MAAYATSVDLAKRFDARDIAMMASDTGSAVADISADANVTAALLDASGDIDAALMVSGMYSSTTLTSVTGNTAATLIRLTCERAIAYLYGRRMLAGYDKYKDFLDRSDARLDRLRKGDNIFDLQAIKDAGVPDCDGPTTIDYVNLGLMRDRTRNHYPRRVLPNGR